MMEMYGHQWASAHGDEPSDTWVQGLAGLSGQQIAHGFKRLLTEHQDWPPNLPQFRNLCLDYDPDAWQRQAHKEFKPLALPDKGAKERAIKKGEKTMAEIRAMF